jgi:hypothetical protein
MKRIWMNIISIFVEKPIEPLSWNYEDFKKGRRWSKTQPHPFSKNLTLWDFCKDKDDSVYTIHNLNKILFNEI